jgi:hypothetical protein
MYGYSPLLDSALAALEREARNSRDAARLLAELERLPWLCSWRWDPLDALETLNRFYCDGAIRARPALMAVLLMELSAANPVPLSLMQ